MSFRYNLGKFPVTVLIYEERASGNINLFIDKAKRIKEKSGESFYWLKRKKIKLPVQRFSNIYPAEKVNVLHLYSRGADEFQPMEIMKPANATDPVLVAREESMKFWTLTTLKDSMTRWNKKNVLEKYLPVIMIIAFGLGLMFIWIGFAKAQEQMTATASVIADMVKNVTANQVEIARILGNVKIVSPVAP